MLVHSSDFWLRRLSDTLEKASSSSSSKQSREVYLELARHYRSLHELSARRWARPTATASREEQASRAAAPDAGPHDFRSVHDALMEAA